MDTKTGEMPRARVIYKSLECFVKALLRLPAQSFANHLIFIERPGTARNSMRIKP